MNKQELARDVKRTALTRLEDAARTDEDFKAVVAWWDRLEENSNRKQRYWVKKHVGLTRDWSKNTQHMFPIPFNHLSWRQMLRGDFLDVLYDCPYDMHELVGDKDISQLIGKLNDNHMEVLYYLAIKCYSIQKVAQMRGQTDRNIRKLRDLFLKNIREMLAQRIVHRMASGIPVTRTMRAFVTDYKVMRETATKQDGDSQNDKTV